METPQFQPAPVSPTEVQGIPSPTGQQPALSQEEMVANIKDMMGKIDNKYQDFQAGKFAYDNKSAEAKSQVLRDIFDLLQSEGVDPSNVEQVGEFLNKIKESNPELYQQIEKIFQDLVGEDTQTDPSQGLSNMNINNTNDQAPQNL